MHKRNNGYRKVPDNESVDEPDSLVELQTGERGEKEKMEHSNFGDGRSRMVPPKSKIPANDEELERISKVVSMLSQLLSPRTSIDESLPVNVGGTNLTSSLQVESSIEGIIKGINVNSITIGISSRIGGGEFNAGEYTVGQFQTPQTMPHLLRLVPKDGGMGQSYFQTRGTLRNSDDFAFIDPVRSVFCKPLDMVYLKIESSELGFSMSCDPFEGSSINIDVPGTDNTVVSKISGNGREDPLQIAGVTGNSAGVMQIVLSLVAASTKIGRFLLLGSRGEQDWAIGERNVGAKALEYEHIRGYVPNDMYDRYPHMPEVWANCHELKWFADEVRPHASRLKFGTIGSGVLSRSQRKFFEWMYANVDVPTMECYANVMEEVNEEKINLELFESLLNSIVLAYDHYGGVVDDMQLKGYSVNIMDSELERHSILTFPNRPMYHYGFRVAELMSDEYRMWIFHNLRKSVEEKLEQAPQLSMPEAMAGVVNARNPILLASSATGTIVREWGDLMLNMNYSQLSGLVSQDLSPQFVNGMITPIIYGERTSMKFMFATIGLKTAFMLTPNLYDANKHVKAYFIHTYLTCFFENEYRAWISGVGYGTCDRGERVEEPDIRQSTRFGYRIRRFTNLSLPNARPVGVDNQRWVIMRSVLDVLLSRRVLITQTIPDHGYRIRGRKYQAPGASYVPAPGIQSPYRPAGIELKRVLALCHEYNASFYGPGERIQNATERNVSNIIRALMDHYVVGFSEWFHCIYCPTYHMTARNPLLHMDVVDPGDEWRNGVGIVEDSEELERLGIHHAPFSSPHRSLFPDHPSFGPIHPTEALYVFTTSFSPGSYFKGGAVNLDSQLDFLWWNGFWNSNDPETIVQVWRRGLEIGHSITEIVMEVGELTRGGLIENDTLRQFSIEAMTSGAITAAGSAMMMQFLGRSTQNETSAMAISWSEIDKLRMDPRLYCPMIITIDRNEMIVNFERTEVDLIRSSIRKNLKVLTSLIFGPTYGVLQLSAGVTFSERFLKNIDYTTIHEISPVEIFMLDDVNYIQNPITQVVTKYYRCFASLNGRPILNPTVIEFESIVELLSICRRKFGISVEFVTFMVSDIHRLSDSTFSFICRSVELRFGVAVFDNVRIISTFGICQSGTLQMRVQAYERMIVDDLPRRGHRSITEIKSYSTQIMRGGVDIDIIVKPLLPVNTSTPPLFTTEVNTVVRRERGLVAKLEEYFPIVSDLDDVRPYVYDSTLGRHVPAFSVHPFGLRTKVPLYRTDMVVSPAVRTYIRHYGIG